MMSRDESAQRYAVLAISLVMAAVFVYAALDKLRDPLQFADSIFGFAILPVALINLLALALPPFEIACGVLLLSSWTRRVAALGITLASLMFFSALSSALLKGLTLDCGCFGAGAPSRPRMWMELGLDVVLLVSATFVYLRSIMRPTPQMTS